VRILAFDTATRVTAVALAGAGDTVERRDIPAPGRRPNHATQLLPLILQAMDAAEVGWEQIERIAVGLGPGTFTGLRIGAATGKALARATGAGLVGVSTLDALAQNVRGQPEGGGPGPVDGADAVLAVLDARRGEVYAAAWDAAQPDGPALLAPQALTPPDLVDLLPGLGSRPLAIGEGAIAFREVLERGGLSIPDDDSDLHLVRASGLCLIAPRLPLTDPDALAPDYQRLPDAQPRSTPAREDCSPSPSARQHGR
jgi:tRNA threonylcarbamoyladenosine biosynthesis protein TsaB